MGGSWYLERSIANGPVVTAFGLGAAGSSACCGVGDDDCSGSVGVVEVGGACLTEKGDETLAQRYLVILHYRS